MRLIYILIILACPYICFSQADESSFPHDLLKFNLYAVGVKNYSFEFERFISKHLSIEAGYRFQPYGYLLDNPLGKYVSKKESIDPEYYGFKTANNALTIDLKYFPGRKKSGRGFFMGLYGRYTVIDLDNLSYSYVDENEVSYNVPLVSNLAGLGGGIEFGYEWVIKKRIVIEYYLLGAHYGHLNGTVKSYKDLSGLTDSEKADLKSQIESLYDIYNINYLNATVTDNGVDGKIAGPFFGFKSGIWIGFAF